MAARKRKRKKGSKWIAGAIKRPGALRRSMGVKAGRRIPRRRLTAAAKKGGKTGRRARLALTLRKLGRKRRRRT